jgi:hypothetical protein
LQLPSYVFWLQASCFSSGRSRKRRRETDGRVDPEISFL